MAIALTGGHVSRAVDFYNSIGKYFIIGGTTPWTNEAAPPSPSISDFKLLNVVGLKKVDNVHLVVPDNNGTIQYRSQNWRIVTTQIKTAVAGAGVTAGATVVPVVSVSGLVAGAKIRVNNLYEGTITSINNNLVTIDTAAPADVAAGSVVESGAFVEGAKYVYVECYLNYDEFPIVTYRQVGLCSGVTPNTEDTLISAGVDGRLSDEYTSLGVLEILDNRAPSTRDENQRELLSLIIEF